MKQIKDIQMSKEGKVVVKRLERAPLKAYLLLSIYARREADPREKRLKSTLRGLFTENTLNKLPRNPVAIGVAVNSVNSVVQALGSNPAIGGRDEIIKRAVGFKTLLTQPPNNSC